MSHQWTASELRRFIGDGAVVFTDRDRQPLPAPAEVRDRPGAPSWEGDIATAYAPDRPGIIRAFREALVHPGCVRRSSFRARSGGSWLRCRIRFLNLLDQPDIAAMVRVVDDFEPLPSFDPGHSSDTEPSEAEVPWARLRCDTGGSVVGAEGMVEQLFGVAGNDLTGRSVVDLAHPDDLVRCLDMGIEALANPGVEVAITVRVCWPGGGTRLVHAVMNVASTDDTGWDLSFRDAERALHNELVQALEGEQLVVMYQPVVEVGTGRMSGAEALVRWRHPTRGLVPPIEFIPLAEASGIIVELGAWVLRAACREAVTWPEDLHVAVNLSMRQLADAAVVDTVADALAASELAPGRLVLEVTESALMDNPDKAINHLRQLKALGVRLAIDDFGTGYSSLLYLKRMPVDILKVDRSFVSGLGHDAGDTAIVASVVALAHAFGIDAVGEGVETVEQHHHLAVLGCDVAQGYLWSRPVPAEQFHELIAGQRADEAVSR
jgi:EAL domain-containing protein (putative c-di-GMP-specific phosphodiesterase class I)